MAKEPIKYESALPALLQQLLPQTEKTTSTANVAPLEQIFGQQQASSTPEGMAALITELFKQGAQGVPALTGAFANATGSRSSNNSGLALSLAELNKTLAGQAAGLVGEQQARAAQTADAIARATKSQTAVRGVDPKLSLLTGLGGTALNFADKQKLFDPLKTGIKGLFGSDPTSAATSFSSSPLDGFLALNDNFSGAAGPELLGAGSFDFAPSDGFDLSSLGSELLPDSFGFDAFGDTLSDFGSSVSEGLSEAASGVSDFFSSFFADGGFVDAKKFHEKAASVKQSYADGGIVRNRNVTGDPVRQQGRLAKNFQGYAQPSASSGPGINSADLAGALAGNVEGPVSTASSFGTAADRADMLGSFGLSALGLVSPIAALAVSALTGTKSLASVAARSVASKAGSQFGSTGASSSQGLGGIGGIGGFGFGDESFGFGSEDDTGLAEAGFGSESFGQGGFGGGFGDSSGGADSSGGSDGGPEGSEGSAEGSGGSDSGSSSGEGEAAGGDFADGGITRGRGTGVSDSIPAKLSDGEFVSSADVVAVPGVRQLLEALQQQFHTPAAVQRAQTKR